MSWWNTVVERLENKENISQAGVFDLQGDCLAKSEDLQLHPRCAKALITGFNDRTGSLFGIHVGQVLFTCYRAGDNVIIGKSTDVHGNMTTFAAMLTEECLIFSMMNGASSSVSMRQGSVISVMKNAISKANGPQSADLQMPLECRVQVMSEELPLIDLGIQP